jgi:hypothetical protein
MEAELVEHIDDVPLSGCRRDDQFFADLAVSQAARQQHCHFTFAWRQWHEALSRRALRRD